MSDAFRELLTLELARTGAGGLGHIIIREAADNASYHFYSQVMGMRGSVELRAQTSAGPIQATFMHCNERDHVVAFGAGPHADCAGFGFFVQRNQDAQTYYPTRRRDGQYQPMQQRWW